MKSIIMADGTGTRLWPLSRKNYPKQFLTLIDDRSLIQITANRLSKITNRQDLYVVAGEEYRLTVIDHLSRLFNEKYNNLILEPSSRNTAPAIALTMKYLLEKEKASPEEILFLSPSDHIIKMEDDFILTVKSCYDIAKKEIITFGIVPDKPETGYGYIELGKETRNNAFEVKRFVEKPDKKTAEEYLKDNNFLWNSGMFMFSIEVMLEAFKEFAPELFVMVKEWSYEEAIKNYGKLKNISIDYAVMEKAGNILCSKLSVNWNDVG